MSVTRVRIISSFLIALFLQPIIGAVLGLENFGPNLLLCLATIIIVIVDDSPLVWACTMITCMIYDIAFSPAIGMATVGVVVSLLLVLAVKIFFYLDNILLVPIVALIGTIGFDITGWLISRSIGGVYSFGYIIKCMAFDYIGNSIVILLLYFLFRKNIEKHRNDIKAF